MSNNPLPLALDHQTIPVQRYTDDVCKENILRQTRTTDKLIRICMFLSGLSVFAQLYLFQPLLPALTRTFVISPSKSSLAVSISTVGMGAGLFLAIFIADRLPRKKMMVCSLLASSILTIFSALATDFPMVIAMCFVKGLLVSGVSAVALAYIREEVSPGKLATTIGLYLSGNTLGGMGGRLIAGFLTTWVSWQTCIAIIGIISLLIGFAFARLLPDSKGFVVSRGKVADQYSRMKSFLSQVYLCKLYLVGFLLVGIFVSVYNYLGFHLETAPFSLSHFTISFIFFMYIAGVAGSVTAGKISAIYDSINIIKAFIFAMVIGLGMLLSNSVPVIVIGLGIMTFSFFGAHAITSRLVSQKVSVGTSTATSLYWLCYYLGSSLIGSASGNIISGFNWTFFVCSLIAMAFASLFVTFTFRKGVG